LQQTSLNFPEDFFMRAAFRIAVGAVLAAFAFPAFAQLSLPSLGSKEVQKLSKGDITKELLLKNGDLDKCRDEHKKKQPKVTGKLVARFAVDKSGSTTDMAVVSSEIKGTTFEKCLTEAIRGWTFSKAKEKSAPFDLPQTF
jgi:hypothetical protein